MTLCWRPGDSVNDESPRARAGLAARSGCTGTACRSSRASAGCCSPACSSLGYFTTRVVARFDGRRWNLPSRIYSDLYVLRPGDAPSTAGLAAKLERLFYQEIDGAPDRPGHFRREKDALEIHTRGFRYPGRTFPG